MNTTTRPRSAAPRILSTSLAALALAGAIPATAQTGGQITPYGCQNPADSLVHLGGQASPGSTLTVGVSDPTGTKPAGSLAFLQLSSAAALGYPCGLPLPGFGLDGGVGELLIELGPAKLLALGPVLYDGANAAKLEVNVPNNPALNGLTVFAQGALLGPVGGLGLTNGLELTFGSSGLPDLSLRAVSATPKALAPGETTMVTVVVENLGMGTSPASQLEVTSSSGWAKTSSVPSLPPGARATITLPFQSNFAHLSQNPHFFHAKVDPQSQLTEEDEANNEREGHKPLFVVEPVLVGPAKVFDHDEVFVVKDGEIVSYEYTDYGPDGAPSVLKQPFDPDKFKPHPETGYTESFGTGIPEGPKVHPELIAIEQSLEQGEFQEYVVDYEHGVPMPLLPDLNPQLPRFAPENLAILETRIAMFEGVRRARLEAVSELVASIEGQGSEVLEHFTLAGAMLVRGKKGMLQYLAQQPQVDHVERVIETDSPPPGDVSDGRDLINSDRFFDMGGTGVPYTALLDTGIRSTHTLFTGPDHIDFEEDCANGNGDCDDTGNVNYDPDDLCNHGTSSAAIYTGNSDLGDAYRGVTSETLDSWKVYNTSCFLDTTAVHRGYDEAVYWGDKVIIAEMQSSQDHKGSIADDADDAYDAGSCTIAANGNFGPTSGTVRSPASAHKAIGVGSYDVDTLANISSQSRGPTPDDRKKPDIQAPTNTVTARTTSSTAVGTFSGTSGATPYAAGAASVWADWTGQTSLTDSSVGKIYAALINSGPNDWDIPFDNAEGAGQFELPDGGTYYRGSRTLSDGESKFKEFNVPAGADKVSVAIWWPEKQGWTHRDIDLYLENAAGNISDSSISGPSVFEHCWVTNPGSGDREIEIYAYDVPWLKSQTVYYSIFVHY